MGPCGAGGDPCKGDWWTDAPEGGGGCRLIPCRSHPVSEATAMTIGNEVMRLVCLTGIGPR
jgi:hypothetical protein